MAIILILYSQKLLLAIVVVLGNCNLSLSEKRSSDSNLCKLRISYLWHRVAHMRGTIHVALQE